jgi:hypothetical protein
MSEIGSGRDACSVRGAVVPGTRRAARRSRAARRNRRVALLRIGLGFLLSSRFLVHVITGLIGLAALAGLAQENEARTVVRLAAWDKQQNLRHQRTALSAASLNLPYRARSRRGLSVSPLFVV